VIEIRPIKTEKEILHVRKLLDEYSAWLLNFGDVFENYVFEIDNLKNYYQYGKIIILRFDNELIGCGCLLKLDTEICELKRMFITDIYRNQGLGKVFLSKIINIARIDNYKVLKLATYDFMVNAITLYKSFGFSEIAPYKSKLIDKMKFFEFQLAINN